MLSSKSINVYIPGAYRSSNTEVEDIKPKFPGVNVVGEVEQRCCSVFFCQIHFTVWAILTNINESLVLPLQSVYLAVIR